MAARVALGYVLFFLGGMFVQFFETGDFGALYYSVLLTSTWLATLVGLLVAWGLWNRRRWAWWLGLVAAAAQLTNMCVWISRHFEILTKSSFPYSVLIIFLLLVFFLGLLLVPPTLRFAQRANGETQYMGDDECSR